MVIAAVTLGFALEIVNDKSVITTLPGIAFSLESSNSKEFKVVNRGVSHGSYWGSSIHLDCLQTYSEILLHLSEGKGRPGYIQVWGQRVHYPKPAPGYCNLLIRGEVYDHRDCMASNIYSLTAWIKASGE